MKVIDFPTRNGSPEVLLKSVAEKHGESIVETLIVAVMADGSRQVWSTTQEPELLCVAAVLIQNLASLAVDDRIIPIDEDEDPA